MNGNKPDNFDLVKMIEAIPGQFEKVITEMTKTAETIGKAIKENLDDIATTSAPSSVDIPSTDNSETPASKSTLTLKDMITLLEINDALEELDQALVIIARNIGIRIVRDIGIGSDGLMRELDKVSSVIVNAAQPAKNLKENEPNEWIYELLEDKSIDNEQKAKLLLGLIER